MISIVVPVYNEQANIEPLCRAVVGIMDKTGESYEILFVDDGSKDQSGEILKNLHQRDPKVKYLLLSRNFGHQIALSAGLDHASGDAVITMDGDLQHPPSLIPSLIEEWKKGHDVVGTIRMATEDAGFFKSLTSRLFYALINRGSEVPILPNAADFRLMDRKIVDLFKEDIRERARFIRGLVSWIGFKQKFVPYTAGERREGQSKYSLRKMIHFAIDGVSSFSSTPLYLSTILGFIISGLSFVYAVYILYSKFFTSQLVPGWTSVMIGLLFLGGIQLVCVGIIGTYVGRIYTEVKKRPLYLVSEKKGV